MRGEKKAGHFEMADNQIIFEVRFNSDFINFTSFGGILYFKDIPKKYSPKKTSFHLDLIKLFSSESLHKKVPLF